MAKSIKRHTRTNQGSLSARLREIIRSRGLTAYSLAKDADIDPGVVQRFVSGRRDVRLETADKIASALGLKLVESAKGRAKTRPTDGSQIATNPPAEAPEADHDDFAVNLSAGEVCDESEMHKTHDLGPAVTQVETNEFDGISGS